MKSWLNKDTQKRKTFKNVDEAMQSYYYITGKQVEALPPEPQLYDFLQDDNFTKKKIALVGAGIIITGNLTYKFV